MSNKQDYDFLEQAKWHYAVFVSLFYESMEWLNSSDAEEGEKMHAEYLKKAQVAALIYIAETLAVINSKLRHM